MLGSSSIFEDTSKRCSNFSYTMLIDMQSKGFTDHLMAIFEY